MTQFTFNLSNLTGKMANLSTQSNFLKKSSNKQFIIPFLGVKYYRRNNLLFSQSSFIKDDLLLAFPSVTSRYADGYYFNTNMRKIRLENQLNLLEDTYKVFIDIFESADVQGEGFYVSFAKAIRSYQHPFIYSSFSSFFANFGTKNLNDIRYFLPMVRGLACTINAQNFFLLQRCWFPLFLMKPLLNPYRLLARLTIPTSVNFSFLINNSKRIKQHKKLKYFSFFSGSYEKPITMSNLFSFFLKTKFPTLWSLDLIMSQQSSPLTSFSNQVSKSSKNYFRFPSAKNLILIRIMQKLVNLIILNLNRIFLSFTFYYKFFRNISYSLNLVRDLTNVKLWTNKLFYLFKSKIRQKLVPSAFLFSYAYWDLKMQIINSLQNFVQLNIFFSFLAKHFTKKSLVVTNRFFFHVPYADLTWAFITFFLTSNLKNLKSSFIVNKISFLLRNQQEKKKMVAINGIKKFLTSSLDIHSKLVRINLNSLFLFTLWKRSHKIFFFKELQNWLNKRISKFLFFKNLNKVSNSLLTKQLRNNFFNSNFLSVTRVLMPFFFFFKSLQVIFRVSYRQASLFAHPFGFLSAGNGKKLAILNQSFMDYSKSNTIILSKISSNLDNSIYFPSYTLTFSDKLMHVSLTHLLKNNANSVKYLNDDDRLFYIFLRKFLLQLIKQRA